MCITFTISLSKYGIQLSVHCIKKKDKISGNSKITVFSEHTGAVKDTSNQDSLNSIQGFGYLKTAYYKLLTSHSASNKNLGSISVRGQASRAQVRFHHDRTHPTHLTQMSTDCKLNMNHLICVLLWSAGYLHREMTIHTH